MIKNLLPLMDRWLDMKIRFGEKTIITTVYALDQLLLSETACQLLGIVSYHPSVQFVGSSQLTEETVNNSEVTATYTETMILLMMHCQLSVEMINLDQ